MKKVFVVVTLFISCLFGLASCRNNSNVKIDYDSVAIFESDVNNDIDVSGKTVKITVDSISPNSAFGYNIMTGEHLNFVSEENPKVNVGDVLVVEVISVRKFLGSYIITYKKRN